MSRTTPSNMLCSGEPEGHGSDTEPRLNAAAVTQSVTLALAAGQAADNTGTPESTTNTRISDAFKTPQRTVRRQHWIHIDVSRSPEIQPYVNETMCIATPQSTDNGYTDAATGCISCQSSTGIACLRDMVDSADSCSVPLGSSGSQDEPDSHPVLKVGSDGHIDVERQCDTTDSAGGTCDLHLSSQLLPCPPSTIKEDETPDSASFQEPK